MTVVASPLRAFQQAAEQRLGRELHPSEHVIDLERNDRTLEDGKARLAAAIEKEKRRAVREYLDGRGPAALRVTDQMLRVLVDLRAAGRAAAREEMRALGVVELKLAQSLPAIVDEDPDLGALRTQLHGHLYEMSRRVERESGAVGVDFGTLAAASVYRRVEERVPGALNAASQLVSRGFGAGLGDVFSAAAGLFDGWLYTAVMDGGTCPVCRALDGTRFSSWEEIQLVLPDGGPNPSCRGGGRCRCRPVPIVDEGTARGGSDGLPPDLTPEERLQIDRYLGRAQTEHGIDYETVNGQLRGKWSIEGAAKKEIDEIVVGLDAAFAKAAPLDEALTVWRGVNAQLDVRVGEVFTDPGFLSTSTSQEFAAGWAEVVGDVWEIELPQGASVLDLRGMVGRESEILLSRNSRIVIESIEELPPKYPGWMPPEAERPQWKIRGRLLLDGEDVVEASRWAGPEWAAGAVQDVSERRILSYAEAQKLAAEEGNAAGFHPILNDEDSYVRKVPARVHRDDEERLLAAGRQIEEEVQRRIALVPRREYDVDAVERQVKERAAAYDAATTLSRERRSARQAEWREIEEQVRRDVYVERATAAGERVSPIQKVSPFDPEVFARREAWYLAQPEIQEAARALKAAHDSLSRAMKFRDVVVGASHLQYRRTLMEVLSELREMGVREDAMIRFQSKGRKGVGKELIDEASAYYPSDWLRAMAARGAIKVIYAAEGRGYFSAAKATIKLSGWDRSKIPGDTPGLPTAIHEIGHFVENTYPEVRTAEWAFFQRRTRAEGYGQQEREYRFPRGQGYSSTESYREDKFTERYMGKTYGNGPTSSYELLTMGVESLWTGSHALDDEMRHFLLGLLVGV